MANEIYSSTWWGFSSSTGFGNMYDKYNNRVEADGGTIESLECVIF